MEADMAIAERTPVPTFITRPWWRHPEEHVAALRREVIFPAAEISPEVAAIGAAALGGGVATLVRLPSSLRRDRAEISRTDEERAKIVAETYHMVIADVRESLELMRAEVMQSRSDAARSESANAVAQSELAKAQAHVSELVAAAASERQTLLTELAGRDVKIADLKREVGSLRTEVAGLKAKVNADRRSTD